MKIFLILLGFLLLMSSYTYYEYRKWAKVVYPMEKLLSIPMEGKEKNLLLNQALEKLLHSSLKRADIHAAIGSLLAEFQEYPLAFYYFRQALLLQPHSEEYQKKLNEIVFQGNLPSPPPLKQEFYLPPIFRYIFMGAVLIFLTVSILRPLYIYLVCLSLVLFPFLMEGAYLFRATFLLPVEGVVIRPIKLYHDPTQEKMIKWIEGGEVVDVLDDLSTVIKIRTSSHELGFVDPVFIRLFH